MMAVQLAGLWQTFIYVNFICGSVFELTSCSCDACLSEQVDRRTKNT